MFCSSAVTLQYRLRRYYLLPEVWDLVHASRERAFFVDTGYVCEGCAKQSLTQLLLHNLKWPHCLQDQAELKQQIGLFEQEKKLMATVPVADNDVLSLNVGGTLLTTKRSTLTQVCTHAC